MLICLFEHHNLLNNSNNNSTNDASLGQDYLFDWLIVTMYYIYIYIYIYAFSRRFYPKRLIVHSGYTLFD